MKFNGLNENKGSMTGITDKRILSWIEDCINICRGANLYIDPSLKIYQEDMGWTRYGYYQLPKEMDSVGIISLNTKLFNMSDKEIKGVILHELAHYLKVQDEFNKKTIMWTMELGTHIWRLVCNRQYERAHHGYGWKRFARILERASGIDDISERTANFHVEDEEGKTKQDYYKYWLICDNCGAKMGYLKQSKAIQHPEYYRCAKCGGKFHVEEV